MGKHEDTIWFPEPPGDDEKPPAVVPVPTAPQHEADSTSEDVERLEPNDPKNDRQA